jgi:signal peptidase
MKTKLVLKYLKYAMKAAWWAVTVLLAILLVTIISAKVNGRVPKVFGYAVIHIVSNSMEETIAEDSYILIKETDPRDVKIRDIICFYSTDPVIYGLPNTHRVISDPVVTENGITFETMGDNCLSPDAYPAEGDRLIGVYVEDLPLLSSFSKALDGNLSFVLVIAIQIGIIAVAAITVITAMKNKEDKEK